MTVFTFSVKVTDANGLTAVVHDTITVGSDSWPWLQFNYNDSTASQNEVYMGNAITWPANTTRSPSSINITGAIRASSNVVAFSASAVDVISDFATAPFSVTQATPTHNNGINHYMVGSYLVSLSTGAGFSMSSDGGLTWADYSPPASANDILFVHRLASGRWVCWITPSAGGNAAYYTDNALPDGGWSAATISGGSGAPFKFAMYAGSGQMVTLSNNANTYWATTDGATWTAATGSRNGFDPSGGSFRIAGDGEGNWVGSITDAAGPTVWRTTDNGVNWTKVLIEASSSSTPYQITYGGGRYYAYFSVGGSFYSDTDGVSWSASGRVGIAAYTA